MNYDNNNVPVVTGNNGGELANLTAGLSLAGAQGSSLAMASAAAAEAIAKIQVAKAFPRNVSKAQNEIMLMCERKTLAEIASYAYAKGGTTVEGASIHLLRAIAQSWGNLQSGYRPDHTKAANGLRSYWVAFACDLERNVSKEIPFEVVNIRHTRNGDKPITDPREIYENVANQAARRERACLECVIPRDIIEDALDACMATLEQKEGTITKEKLDALVESFKEFGVTLEDIEAFIQRKMSSIVPSQLVRLRTIYKSLRDGVAKKEDFFKGAPASAPGENGGTAKKKAKTVDDFLEEKSKPAESKAETTNGNEDVESLI